MELEVDELKQNQELGEEKLSKLFLKYVVPAMLALVIAGMQNIVDGLFLGNLLGANAMSSASLAQPYMMALTGVGVILAIGSTSYMGRILGEGNWEKAKDIFQSTIRGGLLLAFVVCWIGFFGSDKLATLFGANEVLQETTSQYIKTLSCFSVPMVFFCVCSYTNRIVGKPELMFIGTFVSLLSNICLNYFLIHVMGWGMYGAGMATGLSFTISGILNMIPFFNRAYGVNFFEGNWNTDDFKKLLVNGSSEGMTSVSMAITAFAFNHIFMLYHGEIGVASYTVIAYISQISLMLMFGIGDGISPLISFNYGAGYQERMKKILNIALLMNFVLGILVYAVILMKGDLLIAKFIPEEEDLIQMTYEGAKIYGLSFFLSGYNIVVGSYFTAIGNAIDSIIVSMSRGLIFILIGIFLLPKLFGDIGLWGTVVFAEVITIGICQFLFRKEKGSYGTASDLY